MQRYKEKLTTISLKFGNRESKMQRMTDYTCDSDAF